MPAKQIHHNEVINRKSVRDALKHWHHTTKLGSLPLARLTAVTEQLDGDDTAVARGLVLRDILRRTITAFRPPGSDLDFSDTRWRVYTTLYSQFIEGARPYDVAERLFMARSTYNHTQADALDLLVAKLNELEERAMTPNRPQTSVQPVFLAPPMPPQALVGRDDLLSELKASLLSGRSQALFAFNGLPGVGKTALAIATAHDDDILKHFYDGILWGRLGQSANVLAILGQWAVALGVEPSRIAALRTVTQRAEVVHAAIGLRHMLLVIDDAWSVEDALALRLGGPHCAHLVTTRLPEVSVQFAGPGVTPVTELSEEQGMRFLGELAPKAVQAEPELARQLVRIGGGLPLALLLMGNYLQLFSLTNPSQPLAAMMAKLQQTSTRLPLAQVQSPISLHPDFPEGVPLSLPNVIALSESALSDEGLLALHALSVFPPKPNTFSKEAATAVTNQTAETIQLVVRVGLLELAGENRYTLHQSIAEFARQKLANVHEAARRMVGFYASFLEVNGQNYADIDDEMVNIGTAVTLAHEINLPAALVRLVLAFYPYLETRGLYQLANDFLQQAKTAASDLQDTSTLVEIWGNLGQVALDSGLYAEAEQYYREGLTLAETIEANEAVSRLLQGLAVIADHRGEYEPAEALYRQSLSLARSFNQRRRISILLMNLGGWHMIGATITRPKNI